MVASSDILMSARGLTVGYRQHTVVRDVNLDLAAGTITTLIGPNGAGKSTLLKTLTMQLAPLAGDVNLMGRSLFDVDARTRARSVAVLMTERARPELMTCYDVVSAGRYPYTGTLGILSDEDRREVDRAMALVGVETLAGCDFMQISDGQRQLVLLARAICQRPRVLVLDEPTSFLDIRHKLLLLAILKDLVNTASVAVITSLHELDLAQRVSDEVLCVRDGVIDRAGPPEEIFSDGYVEDLYHVEQGSYNETFGAPELAAPSGTARVFIIGGGGSALSAYRRLQRLGVPFDVGVLGENDVETPVARSLAAEVVTEVAYEPIGEAAFNRAISLLDSCAVVWCAPETFGPVNEKNCRLREYAHLKGVLATDFDDCLRRLDERGVR